MSLISASTSIRTTNAGVEFEFGMLEKVKNRSHVSTKLNKAVNKKLSDEETKRLMEFCRQFIEDQKDKYLEWLATIPKV